MADITSRVRFIGDAAQLLATYKAIGAAGAVLEAQLAAQAHTALSRQFGGNLGVGAINDFNRGNANAFKSGAYVKNLRTEIDALNKTFVTTGETAYRFWDGSAGKSGEWKEFLTGDLKSVAGDTDRYNQAVTKLSKVNDTLTRSQLRSNKAVASYNALTGPTTAAHAANLANLQARQAAGTLLPRTVARRTAAAQAAYQAYLNTPPVVAAQRASSRAYNSLINAQRALPGALSAIDTARLAPPPIPFGVQQLGKVSPQFLNILQKAGLGTTGAAISRQNPIISMTRDITTGVTKINAQFDKATGVTETFTGELDKSGKPMTRFGRNLSGIGNILRQTVANFQKVIQWTLATTAVFGTLAFVASELKVIVDLDKGLRQLGVTAQLSSSQTRELFSSLAAVAISTATPLQELIKSSDSIALAVREAGKSAKDFEKDILTLSEAVGIYTNLTGQDTVKATDILVSSMKQLGLETEDVVGLLSKITAVAGGQSDAISDIATGMAVMAEAARQAGLSVDQTIGAVQVLSQVTSKSPTEVATAFKNLTGSLDSRAGAKALASFNIDLRDGAGNLRNILDIYGEISSKIRQGIIPAADVKGLVKAIAGGPRRVPDAAALLSAIDQIEEATQRSISATNEALIVNAKILDTTASKLVIIKAEVDKFAFETLGGGITEFVGSIANGVTDILKIINSLDKGFIGTAIQIGAFLLVLKLGDAVLSRFGFSLLSVGLQLANIPARAIAAIVALKGLNVATLAATRTAVLADGTGGRAALGLVGTGALIGGLSGAGGGPIQALGGALQGAGLAALVSPATTALPWLKLAGAISFATGSLLTFIKTGDDAEDTLQRQREVAEQVTNAYEKFKEAQTILDNLTKTQSELRVSIKKLSDSEDSASKNNAQLLDYQKEYIKNTLDMVDATNQLAEAINDVPDAAAGFREALKAAARGELTKEELDKQIRRYHAEILRIGNPTLQIPDEVQILPPTRNLRNIPYLNNIYGPSGNVGASEKAFFSNVGKGGYKELSLSVLRDNPELVKNLLGTPGGLNFDTTYATNEQLTRNIPSPTRQGIDDINAAIEQLRNRLDPATEELQRHFDGWIAGTSTIAEASKLLKDYEIRVQAISAFNPQQGAELQKIFNLVTGIVTEADKVGDTDKIFTSVNTLYDVLEGKQELNKKTILGLVDAYAALTIKLVDFEQAIDPKITQQGVLDQFNIDLKVLADIKPKQLVDLENLREALIALRELVGAVNTDTTLKAADLQSAFQAGDYKGQEEVYYRQIAQLKAIRDGVKGVEEAYKNADDVEGFTGALEDVTSKLTDINGLWDIQNVGIDALTERLFNLADRYGVAAGGIVELSGKLVELYATIQKIAEIKARFSITADVNISEALAKLRILAAAQSAIVGNKYFERSAINKGGSALDALNELEKENKVLIKFKKDLERIFASGNTNKLSLGGSGSSGSRAGAGKDYSTIDVPDEIGAAYNRDALIQKAIKNARRLQSSLPGATKEGRNDVVSILKGTQKLLTVQGIKGELLRKALEELADIEKKRLEFETKADTIRRIRVGAGDFAAIANVPVNSRTGVSLGGATGPVNITLNLNGTVLTPAQFSQFADQIASALKRQLAT